MGFEAAAEILLDEALARVALAQNDFFFEARRDDTYRRRPLRSGGR
jgi:hypothetical protein